MVYSSYCLIREGVSLWTSNGNGQLFSLSALCLRLRSLA